jgi:hypothetical protein
MLIRFDPNSPSRWTEGQVNQEGSSVLIGHTLVAFSMSADEMVPVLLPASD